MPPSKSTYIIYLAVSNIAGFIWKVPRSATINPQTTLPKVYRGLLQFPQQDNETVREGRSSPISSAFFTVHLLTVSLPFDTYITCVHAYRRGSFKKNWQV